MLHQPLGKKIGFVNLVEKNFFFHTHIVIVWHILKAWVKT